MFVCVCLCCFVEYSIDRDCDIYKLPQTSSKGGKKQKKQKSQRSGQGSYQSGKGSDSDASTTSKQTKKKWFSFRSSSRSRECQTDSELFSPDRDQSHDFHRSEKVVQTDTEFSTRDESQYQFRRSASISVLQSGTSTSHVLREQTTRYFPPVLPAEMAAKPQRRATHSAIRTAHSSADRYSPRTCEGHVQPFVVQFDYSPTKGDQMRLRKGQHVWRETLDVADRRALSGWALVLDPRAKQRGFVPQACLSPLVRQSTVL